MIRGRSNALIEVAILVVGGVVFFVGQRFGGRPVATAFANARWLRSVERDLHIDVELAMNSWLAGHPWLIVVAVCVYRLYYVVLVGVLVFVFVRHREVFVSVRRVMVAMALLVLPVYWAVPMAPPRFAVPGTVDIVAEHDIFGRSAAGPGDLGQMHMTAMPSMHVGWALWCGFAVWMALRAAHPRAALLAWLFPVGMMLVVFTTGNHYVLDVVGSVLLLLAAVGVAAGWSALRARRSAAARF
ncbi:phosphatase PAP2 family protein [Dactylosporangium vinaceum]|uniref:Phosphatase PAP2 family protein n=1 Tax=Dactylosporangium vinaceum TaxID=53362 RepID=A0ABV5MSG7_9ACTN|nr:phosphatase PAP2 family protein [Dactylosporangium vinaceum]